MMYKTPGDARKALSSFTNARRYLIEGEVITPAEDELLNYLAKHGKSNNYRGPNRRERRRFVGLARSLGLYPIPEWWLVRERIKGYRYEESEDGYWTTAKA